MPITWRNVNSRGTGEAARLLEGAGRSINAGLGQFRNSLNRAQDTREENYDVRGDNNTQAFRDKLASYRSPEELAAARESGEIAQFAQSLGRNVDKEVLNSLPRQRLTTLRDQSTTDQNYADTQQGLNNRESWQDLLSRSLAGDDSVIGEFNEGNYLDEDGARIRSLYGNLQGVEDAEFQDEKDTRLRADWARQDEQRETTERLNNFVNSAPTRAEESRAQSSEQARTFFQEAGVMDANGRIPTDVDPAALERAWDAAYSQGIIGGLGETQILRNERRQLREEFPNADPTVLEEKATEMQMARAMDNGVAPEDQADYEEQVALVMENHEWDTNPFAAEVPQDRIKAAADIVNEFAVEGSPVYDSLKSDGSRRRFTREVTEGLNGELEVDGEKIQITPEIARLAVMGVTTSGRNVNFKDAVRDLMVRRGGSEMYDQYLEGKKKMEELQSGFRAATGRTSAVDRLNQARSRYQQRQAEEQARAEEQAAAEQRDADVQSMIDRMERGKPMPDYVDPNARGLNDPRVTGPLTMRDLLGR